jgi:hypothetical protein
MSIRNMLLAAAFTVALLDAAHASELKPIEGRSVQLGDLSGVTYYTVQPDGFRVVTTLAQGATGTPVRFVSVLAPGQRVVFSRPTQAGALEVSRTGDSLLIRNANAATN